MLPKLAPSRSEASLPILTRRKKPEEDDDDERTYTSTKTYKSTASDRSYPEYEFAMPETMPHLIPLEHIRMRETQRSERRKRAQREHKRRLQKRQRDGQRSIQQYKNRLEIRRQKADRLERATKWATYSVHATMAWRTMGRQLWEVKQDLAARDAIIQRRKRRQEAARTIQKALRNYLAALHKSEVRDFWIRSSQFTVKITKHRWRAELHIRCWHRRIAIRKIKTFLRENASNRGTQAVAHFISKVRRIQNFTLMFLDARRERKFILRLIWDDVDGRIRSYIDAKRKDAADHLMVLPEIHQKRIARGHLLYKLPEQVNGDLKRIHWFEKKMDALFERQQAAGARVGSIAPALVATPKLPVDLREQAIDKIMRTIVTINDRLFESKTKMKITNIGTKRGREQILEPRSFTCADASHILSLSSHKGVVRKLQSIWQAPSLGSKAPKMLLFYTAFFPRKGEDYVRGRPRTLLHVVAAEWMLAYNAANTRRVPISLDTVPVDLTHLQDETIDKWIRASRDHVAKSRSSLAFSKLVVHGNSTTSKKRGFLPGTALSFVGR